MTDKNHEQYLEQIETAVANTTMDILEKHSGDLRAMAKLVAEKQVEINRLKEYYNDDKKTIRSLRVKLNEATEEIDLYQRDIGRLVEDKEELKDYIDAIPDKVEEYKDELHAVMGENRMLKEEIDAVKEELEAATAREDSMFQTLNKKRKEESEWAQKKIAELKEQLANSYPILKEEIKELKKGDKRKLKKKVEELEERLEEAWSEYNTEHEEREKAEKELEKLQDEQELMMLQGIYKAKEQQKEIDKWKKTCLRWQEKADFNLTDSDEESEEEEIDVGGMMNFSKYND